MTKAYGGLITELNNTTRSIASGVYRIEDVFLYNKADKFPSESPTGEDSYTTAGTYTWVCPSGVTSVSVVCVGGGGGGENYFGSGGGGGALAYRNDIPVSPGTSYTVVVGAGGVADTASTTSVNGTSGGNSYFISEATVGAQGGNRGGSYSPVSRGIGGAPVGSFTGGGRGGNSYVYAGGSPYRGAGGGGAGGYSGKGGDGSGATTGGGTFISATDGAGGGGGGGDGSVNTGAGNFGAGGGVGILGEGANGLAGAGGRGGGGGGSGGNAGTDGDGTSPYTKPNGGAYGGGGGSSLQNSTDAGNGAVGAVRIIWGLGRAFPSSLTGVL